MTANDIAWAIGIAIPVAIFAVLVAMAVWRYLSEPTPGRHRLDVEQDVDEQTVEEQLRRAQAAWKRIQDSLTWGPCRWCGTAADDCLPLTRPCCSRCAGTTDAHPVVERRDA